VGRGKSFPFLWLWYKSHTQDWRNLSAKDLGVLKKILFPKNVTYHYPDIQTPELSIFYMLNRDFVENKTYKGCLTFPESKLFFEFLREMEQVRKMINKAPRASY